MFSVDTSELIRESVKARRRFLEILQRILHLEKRSYLELAENSVLQLEPSLAKVASPATQTEFQLLKEKAKSLVTVLSLGLDEKKIPEVRVSAVDLTVGSLAVVGLGFLFGGLLYLTMGWSQPFFDSAVNRLTSLDRRGAVLQQIHTQLQRQGLAAISGDVSGRVYDNSLRFQEYLVGISLINRYPHVPFTRQNPAEIFAEKLMNYNICDVQAMLLIPDIPELCEDMGAVSKEGGFDPAPFPNPRSGVQAIRSNFGLDLGILTSQIKNRILELIQEIESPEFQAGDVATLTQYLKDCLIVSNWLFAWSSFRNLIVVS